MTDEQTWAAEGQASAPPPGRPVAIEGRGLYKRYGATQALHDVSVTLERGQVTALAGENGAGKSTLIRLLTGVERPDQGELLRDGVPIKLNRRSDATAAGIFCVYQDQPFVARSEVYRQAYLGYEGRFRRTGLVSDRLMRKACENLLEELEISGISPSDKMEQLSPAAREVVALVGVIAVSRILEVEHPVILLDEPTSALSVEEIEFLTGFIASLKARSALMFVSHRVAEVLDWSDSIWVLRDGRNADFMTRETASEDRVFRAMGARSGDTTPTSQAAAEHGAGPSHSAGSAAASGRAHRPGGEPAPVRFSIAGARLRPDKPVIDFEARAGEMVGLAGVEGSGKEEFLRFCIGLVGHSGPRSVEVDGEPLRRRLRDLLPAGVVYLSGERQRDGVFNRLTIYENIAISRRIAGTDADVVVRRGVERARAWGLVERLAIKTGDVDAPLQSLSGGNQQKVLLGRCLELSPRVMLLDNVTRGVDVGAKESIYELFRALSAEGVTLVFASDDLYELGVLADRVAVFKDGSLVREFPNHEKRLDSVEVLATMV